MFYVALYRFALIPRVLAALGLVAVALQITTVIEAVLRRSVILPLLAPLGLAQSRSRVWLMIKGFADKPT